MNCNDVLERLSPYLDGELSPFEQAQVDAHLRKCAACAEELALLRQTVALLRDLEEVEVPAGFRADLRARLAVLPPPIARAPKAPALPLWRRWGLASAAAAAVAGLVFMNVGPRLASRGVQGSDGPAPGLSAPHDSTGQTPPADSRTATSDPADQPVAEADTARQSDPPETQPDSNGKPDGQSAGPVSQNNHNGPGPSQGTQGPNGTGTPHKSDNTSVPADRTPGKTPIPSNVTVASLQDLPDPVETGDPAMTHHTYRTTVAVKSLAEAQAALSGMMDGRLQARLVNQPKLADGSLELTYEVERDSEQKALALLAELGTVLDQPAAETEDLSGQYNTLIEQMRELKNRNMELLGQVDDPELGELAQSTLKRNQAELNRYQADLDVLTYKAGHSTIVLVLKERTE